MEQGPQGKPQLLSNLILNAQQRLVLIIDENGHEKQGNRIVRQWLNEQGFGEANIQSLPVDTNLRDNAYLSQFLAECRANGKTQKNLHVLLPTLADLLCYMEPSMIFELLHELRNCAGIQCSLIWASTHHLLYAQQSFLIAACEYVCDTIVHILDEHSLCITARKPSGSVTCKTYMYKVNKNEFLVETAKKEDKGDENTNNTTSSPNTSSGGGSSGIGGGTVGSVEHGSTFKIELEEEELVARNAMKLPYEKTSETSSGGNIVYTPDAVDDFDEEDPDEDLCI